MSKSTRPLAEPLMTIPDVAEFCGVSAKTVRRWISAGELLAAKLGGQWRVRSIDLSDFVRERLSQ